MGEIKDLIESMAHTEEDKKRKQIIDETIKRTIEGMTRFAKRKKYTLISTDENQPYFIDIIDFFVEEGFTLRNYQKIQENGIERESIDITWSAK